MDKPTVLFPLVEAGMGHVAPMRAVAEKFKELYGDIVDCRDIYFFRDSGCENLVEFEKRMCDSVIKSNRRKLLGFFITFNMHFWGARIATHSAAHYLKSGAANDAIAHMNDLAPDMVVSTHWATNYFANKCNKKPLTVIYCPDANIYPLFNYHSDIALVPTKEGYRSALKKYKKRYNAENLKYVPTLIRSEAFKVNRNKKEGRIDLGLDPDKFTVVLAEGGYGIGKMTEICKLVLERDLPVNLVPICGKNEELHKEMLNWKVGKKCAFHPVGFTDKMLEYLAVADLFCGKSGANVFAETCYLGVPQIVTKYASGIERMNGVYYVKYIKTAMKIFKPKKVADKIEEFIVHPERLKPFKDAADAQKENYGAEKTAKICFELLCTRFPHLAEELAKREDAAATEPVQDALRGVAPVAATRNEALAD